MRIATWNVNSVKARLSNVLDWLRAADPDVAVLQEIKCETEAFPRFEFEALGYKLLVHGQKSYNGVALLSKTPIEDPLTGLDGDGADTQARYLEATVRGVRVCGLYLPNGNPAGTEKYDYKLAWMERLRRRAETLLTAGTPFVMGGDFNVIPEARDAADPAAWTSDALFLLETRRRFRALLHLGLTDSWRALNPTAVGYSFWDYQNQAWQADNGIRIDHLLVSPELADRLDACIIDREPRGRDRASDHTPVVATLSE
ncbi:exodeoxyribonuclease III [Inquilinus limosus]|uniref:exodeoxyribonuclease III n=1 Tax=Inquilinus limosus TaxID=171674 RepID=UPI0003FB5B80|nr:exodeoxyribonuclease III [Inquilinus limosus]